MLQGSRPHAPFEGAAAEWPRRGLRLRCSVISHLSIVRRTSSFSTRPDPSPALSSPPFCGFGKPVLLIRHAAGGLSSQESSTAVLEGRRFGRRVCLTCSCRPDVVASGDGAEEVSSPPPLACRSRCSSFCLSCCALASKIRIEKSASADCECLRTDAPFSEIRCGCLHVSACACQHDVLRVRAREMGQGLCLRTLRTRSEPLLQRAALRVVA